MKVFPLFLPLFLLLLQKVSPHIWSNDKSTRYFATNLDEAKELIESNGGKSVDSVSKKTSVVIVGKNPGSKYDKAKALGIYIMNEEEFLSKIKE